MGIRANIQLIKEKTVKTFESQEAALNSLRWMFQEMTPGEETRLRRYLEEHLIKHNGQWTFDYKKSHQWAVIWWDKETE
jgi:hypothetical protein